MDKWNIDAQQYESQVEFIPQNVLLKPTKVPNSVWLTGRLQMSQTVSQVAGRASKVAVIHLNESAVDQIPAVGDLVSLGSKCGYPNRWRILQISDDLSLFRILRSDHRHPNARTVSRPDIRAVLAETINVFNPKVCAVTLRHWGGAASKQRCFNSSDEGWSAARTPTFAPGDLASATFASAQHQGAAVMWLLR